MAVGDELCHGGDISSPEAGLHRQYYSGKHDPHSDPRHYLEPLSALLFSAALLGEKLTPSQLVGALLILGGAAFGELKKSRDVTLPSVVKTVNQNNE
ncbi:MAG: EamA family transporter [Desulfitobacterium sp.]